jgi:hypothetical protein
MSTKLVQEFYTNRDQTESLNPELFIWSCSQLFELKKLSLLSMHCIAYAFGKLGCTNVLSHGNSILIPYLSCFGEVLSHNQRCRDGT